MRTNYKRLSFRAAGSDPLHPATPSVTRLAGDAGRHLPRRGRQDAPQGRPSVACRLAATPVPAAGEGLAPSADLHRRAAPPLHRTGDLWPPADTQKRGFLSWRPTPSTARRWPLACVIRGAMRASRPTRGKTRAQGRTAACTPVRNAAKYYLQSDISYTATPANTKPKLPSFHRLACFWRRVRESAIMAMNSLFVGLPLIFDTV